MSNLTSHIKIDRSEKNYIKLNISSRSEGITDDTIVRQSQPDTIFYPTNFLIASNFDSATDYYTFIKIDTRNYNVPVIEAKLLLRIDKYFNDNELPIDDLFWIAPLSTLAETDSWDEETITWNNQPVRDAGNQIEYSLGLPDLTPNIGVDYDADIEFNITSLINLYINAGLDSATIVLQRKQGSVTFWSTHQDQNTKPLIQIII